MHGLAGIAVGLIAAGAPLTDGARTYERRVTLAVDALSVLRERVAQGAVTAQCTGAGTTLHFDLAGLVPDGTYSLWMFLFEETREAVTPADAAAAGALGSGAGGGHEFRADSLGRARVALRQPAGPLSAFGRVRGCLLDEPQWRVVGAYHPRRVTAGTSRPAAGDALEHFGVRWGN